MVAEPHGSLELLCAVLELQCAFVAPGFNSLAGPGELSLRAGVSLLATGLMLLPLLPPAIVLVMKSEAAPLN